MLPKPITIIGYLKKNIRHKNVRVLTIIRTKNVRAITLFRTKNVCDSVFFPNKNVFLFV